MTGTAHSSRTFAVALAALVIVCVPMAAAELTPDTVRAWDAYVRATEARIDREVAATGFLWPIDRSALSAGRILADRIEPQEVSKIAVPDGMIHHWRGAVLVRSVTVQHVLDELQSADPSRHLQQDVLEWRLLADGGDHQRVFLKLVRKEIVTVTYNTEHEVDYRRLDANRAISRSVSVRIAELENAGTAREQEKATNADHGFLWRLNSYWRYQQTPEGVIIEVESLTLSRDVPAILRPIIRPLIDGVARESMTRTLDVLRRRIVPK